MLVDVKELKEFLADNLEIKLDISEGYDEFNKRISIKVSLVLDNEVISSESDYFTVKDN